MKLIGVVVLFFAVFQIGLRKVEKLRQTNDFLHDLWFAIGEIGRQIALAQKPLPEIYKDLAKGENGKTNLFGRLCIEGDFAKVYDSLQKDLPRIDQLDNTMQKFLRVLGKTEAQEQVTLCTKTASSLRQILETEQSAFTGKRKMYLAVAACAGGMLVLFVL